MHCVFYTYYLSITFQSIETAVETIRRGGIVVVMDDEDRENEGDLIMAAQFATPEKVLSLAHPRRHTHTFTHSLIFRYLSFLPKPFYFHIELTRMLFNVLF